MSLQPYAEFLGERESRQQRLLDADHLGIKRFLRLDAAAYEDSALPADTKELLGLVASLMMRRNDCIDYHLGTCVKAGFTRAQIIDAMHICLVVGGTINIPALRRALERLDEVVAYEEDHAS